MSEQPTIAQADRDAAGDLVIANKNQHSASGRLEIARLMRAGTMDHNYIVQAFAKYRTTSAAAQDGLVEANKQLRMALGDLLSWFPDKPTKPHWQIEAGEQGADDAITYARELFEKGSAGNDAA